VAEFVERDGLAVEHGRSAAEGVAEGAGELGKRAVKSLLFRLVSRVVPSGLIRMAAR
jgi:hypothetical protein